MTSVMEQSSQTISESVVRGYVSREVWHPSVAGLVSETVADVEVSGGEDGEHVLILANGARCGSRAAVLLPRVGQDVRVEHGGATFVGHFLGLLERVYEGTGQWCLRGSILTASGVQTVVLPPEAWAVPVEARGGGFTGVSVDAAVRALAEVHVGSQRALQAHEAWKDRTVERAHEYADDNDLCGRFDDFMEEVGLPSRRRSETVTLSVQVDVEVELGRHDEACDFITEDMVRDELRRVAEQPNCVTWEEVDC